MRFAEFSRTINFLSNESWSVASLPSSMDVLLLGENISTNCAHSSYPCLSYLNIVV